MRVSVILAFAATAAGQSFVKDVSPILSTYCYGCHSAAVKLGSLDVETFEGLQRGGNHGPVLVPGKSAESRLYRMLTGQAKPAMPMDGRTLAAGELEVIRKWIDAGAKGPTPGEQAVARQPQPRPARPAIPDLQPRTPVKPQIFSLAWRSDGGLLAAAGHKEVRLLDPLSGRTVSVLSGHADAVRAVAFSPDGSILAAAGGLPARSGQVKLWDAAQRQELRTLAGHGDCIYAVAFSPDGRTLATSSYDKLVKLWDVATGRELRTLKDHIDAVYALAFTRDGRRVVSGAADRTVKVWDAASGERLLTLGEPLDGINTLALDPASTLVAAAGLDKTIRIWRLEEKQAVLVNSLIAHEDAILKLAWSPDGATLISSSADRVIKVFRAPELTELKAITRQSDWTYGLEFSPDGKRLAAGRYDGSLSIYDLAHYKDLLETRRASGEPAHSLARRARLALR